MRAWRNWTGVVAESTKKTSLRITRAEGTEAVQAPQGSLEGGGPPMIRSQRGKTCERPILHGGGFLSKEGLVKKEGWT